MCESRASRAVARRPLEALSLGGQRRIARCRPPISHRHRPPMPALALSTSTSRGPWRLRRGLRRCRRRLCGLRPAHRGGRRHPLRGARRHPGPGLCRGVVTLGEGVHRIWGRSRDTGGVSEVAFAGWSGRDPPGRAVAAASAEGWGGQEIPAGSAEPDHWAGTVIPTR